MTPQCRLQSVKALGNCFNCLGSHQKGTKCGSRFTCRECQKAHHTMLHFPTRDSARDSQVNPTSDTTGQLNSDVPTFNLFSSLDNPRCKIWLSTAKVLIRSKHGQWFSARALLDSASHSNYMTKRLADQLQLHQSSVQITTKGIGGKSMVIDRSATTTIASQGTSFETSIPFLITKDITGILPSQAKTFDRSSMPTGITLADDQFDVPSNVDVLLGTSIFWNLVKSSRIQLPNGAILVETVFGWIVSGEAKNFALHDDNSDEMCHLSTLESLKSAVEQFWKTEDYRNDKRFLTDEECDVESHFERTYQRKPDGRFMVNLPLTNNIDKLSNNYNQAFAQFIANEKRLMKHERLRVATQQFMNEYSKLGHMSLIDITSEPPNALAYYLPHHAVEKPESTTTSVRVVFNGSAKTKSGLSFNDVQLVGPKVQPDLLQIQLKFRLHAVVIKADIAKMYRQVEIIPEQRKFQRILWREDPNKKIQVYELNTITYGTASASYQSTRCLKQLSIDHKDSHPQASYEIANSFYVDDLASGEMDVPSSIKLSDDIVKIITSAGMKLRKFASNSQEFLSHIPIDDCEMPDEGKSLATLGISWYPHDDTISYNLQPLDTQIITRRTVLSGIAAVFDLLGLVGPVILYLKRIMKMIWNLKTSWDESLPEFEADLWRRVASTITCINQIRLPRQVLITNFFKIEVHGFSDASEFGFGAAVYFRSEDSLGNIMCNLTIAKSRIASSDAKLTIPRLELCSAVIFVNLVDFVLKTSQLKVQQVVYWMDSTIALNWIKNSPSSYQTFVANRTSEIQQKSHPGQWRHIESELNPADLISRGFLPDELLYNTFWFNGPSFLTEDESQWPKSILKFDPEDTSYKSELKRDTSLAFVMRSDFNQSESNIIVKITEDASSFAIAKRKVAVIVRFVFNCRNPQLRRISTAFDDIIEAEHVIIRNYQKLHFSEAYNLLQNGLALPKRMRINNLSPIFDHEHKIIRVGGRLKNAKGCANDQRHPVLVPQSHLSLLITREAHHSTDHGGQQQTLAQIRQKYWPLQAKVTVNSVVRNCVTCFRCQPKMVQQYMGQLPEIRVNPAPPFAHTGVDYAGPITIKLSHVRNAKTDKAFVAVFVCLATKAVHLELVSGLSTKQFMAAFDRFIARRGKPVIMMSDNGLNFVGANNEIKDILKFLNSKITSDEVNRFALRNEIEWRFISPRAPEHGGLWEAAVKSMKKHLKRIIGNANLTFEELSTVLARIEATLNSRPLTALSDDPNDLQALTAGHFLIGRPLNCKPERDIVDIPENRLIRWDRITQMSQHFWKRWTSEYLHRLQTRTKNFHNKVPIRVGQLVLLDDEKSAPMHWPLGKVIAIHPGDDNLTRVAQIKTINGIYKRPVNKLALIPDENEQTNQH